MKRSESERPVHEPAESGHHRLPRVRWIVLGVFVLLALLWLLPVLVEALTEGDALPELDFSKISRPYLLIFSFCALQAVIPIFPSESLLTAASTVAAQGELELWPIIIAGALGAIVGDSLLYWLARTLGRRLGGDRLERARENPKVSTAFEFLGQTAPLLIVAGRFVPGLRFVVGATMGLGRYPYPKFLLWSSIGGFLWSGYACLMAYWMGSRLGDYPVVSMLASALVTTALLALLYFPLKSRWEEAASVDQRTPADAIG